MAADLKVAWDDWQLRIASFAIILSMLLQVTWIKKVVDRWVDPEWLNLSVVLPTFLLLILWQTVEITRRIDVVEGGTHEVRGSRVESVVAERIERIRKEKHQTLEVLGLNLRYGWPQVRRLIQDDALNGWTVRVSAFVPAGAQTWVPVRWPELARGNLDEAAEFASEPAVLAKEVSLSAYSYSHPPAVHGYRLGNGDIYVAQVLWNASSSTVGGSSTYEFIRHGDRSPKAMAMRKHFMSWLKAAQEHPHGSVTPD